MDLSGRHGLVTGGGTGIGLAIARMLADAGAEVTITGRRAEVLELAAEGNPRLHPAVMDVTDADQVADVIGKAAAKRGPVAICVANAGVAEGRSLAKTDPEFWRWVMATNLDGVYLTFRAAMASLRVQPKDQSWGRMIAISSVAGTKGLKGAPAYSASKHGVIGLVRSLAQDFAGKGVTFNALCPAYVATDIIERNVLSIQQRTGMSAEEARALMVGVNPHGRLIEPEEVAAAAAWLVGPESGSVNGQAIEISGGVI